MTQTMTGSCTLIRDDAVKSFAEWLVGQKQHALELEWKKLNQEDMSGSLYYAGRASAFDAVLSRFAILIPVEEREK